MSDNNGQHFWKEKSVLVTGATGFLGGWLVQELAEKGAHVVAMVRRQRQDSQLYLAGDDRRVTVVMGDVADRAFLEDTLERYDVNVIFHTAMSGGGVQATLAEPIQCLQSTVESTWWLLDFLRRKRSQAIMVVCSSDKAYGEQETPYRETQALRPKHPQEVAKASQDLLTQSFGKIYELNVAVTRCGNFFGAYDFNFTRIIPYVARCCALGERPQMRSDGRFVRDFLAIQEAAAAHLMLAQELSSRPELRGEVFNFSYEVQMTMAEIVARIMRHANSGLESVITNSARNEIPSMGLSCDKARAVLNWMPRLGFEESLAATTAWYLDWFTTRRAQLDRL
jgi:CDP-glucose 4,6-dehydratase